VFYLCYNIKVNHSLPNKPEYDSDFMTIDEYLVPRKEASYLVRVSDSSLVGEGIYEGDMVVVERGRQARLGDIVLVCGEYGSKLIV
jgi:DNA polymerase V